MSDSAFINAGKMPGIEVWRIENLKPVRVPADQIGKFYSGDSYIILKTNQTSSSLSWNIHFWLGKETSQDESGVAAYKTVELDESLGGGPVQYRECQDYESELFLSYFKNGSIEYLEGGVASGFKTVKRDEYETRLFQIKGKRTVRVVQVPAKNTSLTTDDVYVLDCGLELYVYNGKNANRMEKAKGLEFVRKLNNEARGSRANIIFIDEDLNNEKFWNTLGGIINVTREGGADDAYDRMMKKSTRVLHVSDAESELRVEDVTPAGGVLTKDILHTDDVFIVDVGDVVYIWVGKRASSGERKNAMNVATTYLEKNGRSPHTPITRVVEAGEPPVFKSLFKAWTPPKFLEFGRQPSKNIATASQRKLDVNALVSPFQTSEEDIGVDPTQDGTHEIVVWRIENMEKIRIPEATYGQFYGGDSYIVLHTVTPRSGKRSEIIYFWQGRTSSTDEKASAALLAKQLDDELGGSPVQVRVVQGKEPAHFRTLFKGRMIVHSGGKASGFINRTDCDSYDTDGVSLYHVKGTKQENTVGSQVDEIASNLNSGDCFVLVTPNIVYEWQGSGSSAVERQIAHSIAEILREGRTSTPLLEGSEPDEFWGFLGGKTAYPTEKSGFECPHQPRLFHGSNSYGYFHAEEILDFSQDDLNVDDVFLLDTYTTLFIWIGKGANESEKRDAVKLADEYLAIVQGDGRGEGTPVITVTCGSEPNIFTSNFLAWDPAYFSQNEFIDPYEARLQKIKEEKERNYRKNELDTISSSPFTSPIPPGTIEVSEKCTPIITPPAPVSIKIAEGAKGQSFTYDQLLAGVDGIDVTCRESYLSDAEFVKVMGMSKSEFATLAKWRQVAKKKEVSLF